MTTDLGPYRGWLLRVASNMTTGENIQDLAQEGWIAMWRASHTHKGGASLDYWLKYKAIRAMLEYARRQGKGGVVFKGGRQAAPEGDALKAPLPFDPDVLKEMGRFVDNGEVESAYHQGEIVEAINSLTTRQREWVYLKYFRDYSDAALLAHFKYPASSLWYNKTDGARWKLQEALSHLEDVNG